VKSEDQIENIAIIILAAGLGTRMKSDMAKVLHPILGIPMICHVLETACTVAHRDVIVVVGHQADRVKQACRKVKPVSFALQAEQNGTGHAVLCAMPAVPESVEHVVILCGDVPLLKSETLSNLVQDHVQAGRDLTLLAVELPDPTGYGRVIMNTDRQLTKIVEEADADDVEKAIALINSGIYCVSRPFLAASLMQLKPNNAQGELYLTDIIEVGYGWGKQIGVLVGPDPDEVSGVNTVEHLQAVERLMAARSEKT
jgi:UDP-N-acetylglucosamine diphosphorylase/glucosamine-1-phosphate N-acetyltransferase